MKKVLLLSLFLFSGLIYSKSAKIKYSFSTGKSSNSGVVTTELNKTATDGTENLAFIVTPKESEMNGKKGLILEIKVIENQKVIAAPKLFVENNKEVELNGSNYPGVPKKFSLKIKPVLI